jgi:hypothetical protein
MSEQRSMASDIVDEVLISKAVIFVDQYKNPHIAFEGNGNNVSEINHAICRQYITYLSYDVLNHVPSTTTENQVIKVLEAKARRSGERNNLDISITRYHNAIMYDLGCGAVRITDKSWNIVRKPPIVFRKSTNQYQQVKPKRGGDVKTLLEFVNITNESEQLLFLCYVITTFIPDIQHPVLILHGTQGAGKTILMQIIKSLVDHSELDSGFNQPKDEQDLALNAYHNYVLFYDNVSTMTEKLSDALCKTVTGSTFTTRKLYTNSEVFAFKFKRPVILNGLSQIVAKSDLLDRSLVMQPERITADNRKEPIAFWAEFDEAKPYILGAIFDTLIKAQAAFDKVQPDKSSRMTEFDHWGCAIAEVLGYGQDKFKLARSENMMLQHGNAIEASSVGQAIAAFMEDKTEWSGAPAKLYGLLEPIWNKLHLEKPKDTPRLSKTLNTLLPNLLAKGIKVTRPPRGEERNITITKLSDATDGNDSRNG